MSIKEKVLNTSLDLFVSNGFHGTSIKLILETSGVSNGGLYHHFSSKEDIVRELYINMKTELAESIAATIDEDTPIRKCTLTFWNGMINWSLDNPKKRQFLDMFLSSPYVHTICVEDLRVKYHFIAHRFKDAINNDEFVDMDLEYMFINFKHNTDSVVDYLTKYPDKRNDEFIKFTFDRYWRSIVNF